VHPKPCHAQPQNPPHLPHHLPCVHRARAAGRRPRPRANPGPAEAELREQYQRWIDSLGTIEYRTRHLLVGSRDEAAAALGEIEGGAPFATVAARVSLDTGSKAKGGDLGWVIPAHFVPEFRVVFVGTRTGLHPEPVKTPFGWHVVLVEKAQPAQVPSFEEMRPRLEANARSAKGASSPSPGDAAKPLPAWSVEQWNLVYAAAQHTAGFSNYVYRVAQFDDADKARRGAAFRLSAQPAHTLKEHRARNLVDVEPALRLAVARLYTAASTSAPVARVLPDARQVWQVVQLVSRGDAPRLEPTEALKADLAAWVDKGLLPPPDQLNNAQAQARSAYWRATNEAQVTAVPTNLPADIAYGDESTPLLDAILRDDMGSAKVLVQRGADVNRCGVWGCPITHAAARKEETRALAWVDWLLQAGARADARDARGSDVFDTALGAAAYKGYQDVAQRLLTQGAAIDGDSAARSVPVEDAAMAGNQAMVEWLVARGASLLPRPDPIGFAPRSVFAMASDGGHKPLAAWAERKIVEAASRSPLYRFTFHIEQNGRRVEPNARQEVALKAAPFKLVFAIPEGVDGVQVGASMQPAWLDEVRATDLRNAMFRPFASGALSSTDKPDSKELLLTAACPPGASSAPTDLGCEGGYMSLGVDEAQRKDFHERRKRDGKVVAYVRDIDTLIDTSLPDGKPAPSMTVAQAAGKTIHVAMAVPVGMGGSTGLRMINPQFLKIVLK
jgi:PPIC-type PPIASE domain